MDPKNLEKMMKQLNQMGLKQRSLDAGRVIIECGAENIIISDPSVMEIEMHGQKSYQISGKVSVSAKINEDDLELIMEQAGASHESAEKALADANGDIAKAILNLKGE
ncbi:hypothetical protein AUJ13_05480 [Candidatus Micrarchaeota archaeon CG1_02_49_24]|nr:MAG: hypothetical protein AUJ13_05480 [Candidatus Micrarchaeota archaeon CG1_02_49_24]